MIYDFIFVQKNVTEFFLHCFISSVWAIRKFHFATLAQSILS